MIKTNRKNIIHFACEQGKIFRKFKEDRKFKNVVEQFGINRSTLIFNF